MAASVSCCVSDSSSFWVFSISTRLTWRLFGGELCSAAPPGARHRLHPNLGAHLRLEPWRGKGSNTSQASKSGHRSPSETRTNHTIELKQSETSHLPSEEPEVVQGPRAGRITTRERSQEVKEPRIEPTSSTPEGHSSKTEHIEPRKEQQAGTRIGGYYPCTAPLQVELAPHKTAGKQPSARSPPAAVTASACNGTQARAASLHDKGTKQVPSAEAIAPHVLVVALRFTTSITQRQTCWKTA